MATKFLLDGPVFAGSLIKFRIEGTGSVLVTNKNLNDDDFELSVLAHRRLLSATDPVEASNDDKFVQLMPALTLTPGRNSQVLTKGNYALRAEVDGNLTIALMSPGVTVAPDTRKQDALDRVLTQYRESPNLLAMITAYTKQVCLAEDAVAAIPGKFDIDTAVGDQLTIIGRWLGFPRCHNVPSPIPVFGFECEGQTSNYNLAGFCVGALWLGCPGVASFDVCINNDDLYRNFLYVRRYQLLGRNDYRTFALCIRILFGDDAAYTQAGRVITVSPGRELTDYEMNFLPVYERVLPRAVSASINIQL